MAVDEREGLKEHAKFTGLRNNVPADRFELTDLVSALNVDVDDSARLTRRYGHSTAVLAGSYKSLWSGAGVTLVVKGETQLVRVHPGLTEQVLRTGLSAGVRMSYAAVGDRAYYSNDIQSGVIDKGVNRTWGMAPPASLAVAVVNGVLEAGRYQVAMTYLRNDGQESGCVGPGLAELPTSGGLLLDLGVAPDDATIQYKIIYLSKCNGETLYRVGAVAPSETTFTYLVDQPMEVPLATGHLRPPPAGHLVSAFGGARTLVAKGSRVYYSEPFAPELFDLRKHYQLEDRLTLLVGMDDGAYVSTVNGVSWLAGTIPEKWEFQPKLSYGAVPYAFAMVSRDMLIEGGGDLPTLVFATKHGICMGENGGGITNLTQDKFDYPAQDVGALLVRRHRGMIQTVLAMQGAEQSANVSS